MAPGLQPNFAGIRLHARQRLQSSRATHQCTANVVNLLLTYPTLAGMETLSSSFWCINRKILRAGTDTGESASRPLTQHVKGDEMKQRTLAEQTEAGRPACDT